MEHYFTRTEAGECMIAIAFTMCWIFSWLVYISFRLQKLALFTIKIGEEQLRQQQKESEQKDDGR